METRQTFEGLAQWEIAVWYTLVTISTIVLLWGIARLVRKYRRGRRQMPIKHPLRRLWGTAIAVGTHSTLRHRHPIAGVSHALTFYGFVALFIGTVILAFNDDFTRLLFGYDFWHGGFYLGYSLVLDVSGAALIIGLGIMAIIRWWRPFRLDYWRPDRKPGEYDRTPYIVGDWVFLGSLFFLALTGFLLEAVRIADHNPSFEVWSPIGWVVGQGFRGLGLRGQGAASLHFVLWWIHGAVALAFVASIPFTKAVHMLVSPTNLAVREEQAGQRLPPVAAGAASQEIGYGRITDLSWQHLVSLDACTKCGRCHEACPATAAGYPLSPRDLVLDLREAAEGSLGIRAALHIAPLFSEQAPLVDGLIHPDTVWSCTQCMACVEACPVGIEHVPIINQLRRGLVERGEMDSMLQATLETIHANGNSFGEQKRKRPRWARELPFEVKDIRKQPAELLWFVGDYASFDPRNQRVSRALATVLHHTGSDFGILAEAEKTAGCDVRRAGEEGLWASLAEENVATIKACQFERIFSSDPHSYHTVSYTHLTLPTICSV